MTDLWFPDQTQYTSDFGFWHSLENQNNFNAINEVRAVQKKYFSPRMNEYKRKPKRSNKRNTKNHTLQWMTQ